MCCMYLLYVPVVLYVLVLYVPVFYVPVFYVPVVLFFLSGSAVCCMYLQPRHSVLSTECCGCIVM